MAQTFCYFDYLILEFKIKLIVENKRKVYLYTYTWKIHLICAHSLGIFVAVYRDIACNLVVHYNCKQDNNLEFNILNLLWHFN